MNPDSDDAQRRPADGVNAGAQGSRADPDLLTAQALLNCLVREVSVPEEQTWEADGYLMVRLARSDRLLRLATRRASAGPGPRLTGDAALRRADRWAAGRLGGTRRAHRR